MCVMCDWQCFHTCDNANVIADHRSHVQSSIELYLLHGNVSLCSLQEVKINWAEGDDAPLNPDGKNELGKAYTDTMLHESTM